MQIINFEQRRQTSWSPDNFMRNVITKYEKLDKHSNAGTAHIRMELVSVVTAPADDLSPKDTRAGADVVLII